MDRRQRRTRESIFRAFSELLSHKEFNKITVGEIISEADIGRATFYSHFETKDCLLKAFCEELFCHVFDTESKEHSGHKHIFECEGSESVLIHLFSHIKRNDNNILKLLSSQNNELFLSYFKKDFEILIERYDDIFETYNQNYKEIPKSFLKNHIVSAFVETLKWWIDNGAKESPEKITEYYLEIV